MAIKRFRDLPVSVKVLTTILFSLVIPLMLLFAGTYRVMENILAEKIVNLFRDDLDNRVGLLEENIHHTYRTYATLSHDAKMREYLEDYARMIPENEPFRLRVETPEFLTKHEYLTLSTGIRNILDFYKYSSLEECEYTVVLGDGQIISTSTTSMEFEDRFVEVYNRYDPNDSSQPVIHRGLEYGNREAIYLTFFREVALPDEKEYPTVWIMMTTPTAPMVASLENDSEDFESYVTARDRDRQLLYASPDIPEELLTLTAPEGEPVALSGGEEYLQYSWTVPVLDWDLRFHVMQRNMLTQIYQLRFQISITILAIVLISIWMTRMAIHKLLHPLTELKQQMEAMERGELDQPVLEIGSRDEVGVLTNTFNDMVREINLLMDKNIQIQKEYSKLEFEVLLAQINPHFLFNTLNSIKWMALIDHEDKIAETITSLGTLLTISMNKQAEFIPVSEELNNLNCYINIQKVRYGSAFEIDYDVSEEICSHRIMKLVLQPIVENAIMHNMGQVSELRIHVRGGLEDGKIKLVITDTGTGIPPEKLETILTAPSEARSAIFRGIGISNVHQRIRLKYGEPYGLYVRSEVGRGTEVSILLPVSPEKREGST